MILAEQKNPYEQRIYHRQNQERRKEIAENLSSGVARGAYHDWRAANLLVQELERRLREAILYEEWALQQAGNGQQIEGTPEMNIFGKPELLTNT